MSVGLDTSIVLRLLTGLPQHQTEAAQQFILTAASSVVVSDLVVSEAYFALRHHYAVPHAKAVSALLALLNDARIQGSGNARRVLSEMKATSKPGLIDRLICADYAREDLESLTFDREFASLPSVRLLAANR